MNNPMEFLLAIGAIFVGDVADAALSTSSPSNIGTRLELFVDDALIDEMRGLTFTLHAPTPSEVALTFDRPWE